MQIKKYNLFLENQTGNILKSFKMNNPCSTSKKDMHHQGPATHHIINLNSPANIIKKARESLQKPSQQKPASHQGFKRPNPQLKVLSQGSLFLHS